MAAERHRSGAVGDVAAVEAKLLATLLELTVVVAQTGTRVVPSLEPPLALRPFVQFTAKVPAAAFRAARRVLDEDPMFRARVATVATDELVGQAGSLYVRRPEGWESTFRDVVIDAMGDASNEGAAKRVGRLEKKLAGLQSALARSETDLARVRVELVVAHTQLAEERRLRTGLAVEATELHEALSSAERAHLEAAGDAREATALVGRLSSELLTMSGRAESAEEALLHRDAFDTAATQALDAVQRLGSELRSLHLFQREATARFETERRSPGESGPTVPSGVAVKAPTGGSGATGPRVTAAPGVATTATTNAPTRAATKAVGQVARHATRTRRKPIALPPGVFDDTPEAASALFRTTDVLVLVDAYNVAKWRWPTVGPGDLRARLVAMAGLISQRTGATIHLVFDGAHSGSTLKPGGSAKVRVVYTEAGVEADDVVLAMAAKAPVSAPIVVVSNDMRVVDGALGLGVNVVPNQAFAALAGSG